MFGDLLANSLRTLARPQHRGYAVAVVRDAGASVAVSVLASVAVLVAVGHFASWLPARRVLRISPSAALRGD
jgi:ABC-type lipoprotein release transport system permease subunit